MATDLPDWSAPGRPAFYDRNPLAVNLAYLLVGIAPHAETQRWSYTVPAGRKCQVNLFALNLVRATVAAPAAESWVIVEYTPSVGLSKGVFDLESYSNVVDGGRNGAVGSNQVMSEGDNVDSKTGDTSTGGSQTYTVGFAGTEFDA